jgi:hypothetical protein
MKKPGRLLLANEYTMTSFTIIENAVKMGLITYKELVEQLCVTNSELADQLFKQVSPAEDDPKVLRKMHKAAQVAKFGKEDTDSVKQAMKAYDASVKPPSEPKPKRAPPVRVWTDEDKVRTKAKNAFVKAKMKELGDDITLAEQKIKKKEFIAEFARQAEEAEEAEEAVEVAVEEADEDAVEVAVEVPIEKGGLSDAEQKEWSGLKKKDNAGSITDVEKVRYKELKKKKGGLSDAEQKEWSGLSDAEQKEWSGLKKKDNAGSITDVEKVRYKELKKKKDITVK